MNAPGFKIELNDVRFHAFHGVHEEERKIGNEFIVNLSVEISTISKKILHIKDTVNYVSLFEIVREQMNQPKDLLETVAVSIADRIHEKFPLSTVITIRIAKINPVIPHFSGNVSVTYSTIY